MSNEILTHEEVLAILSQQAQNGSVEAAVALERALCARQDGDEAGNAIDRILTKG